jgi:hypothetical protein
MLRIRQAFGKPEKNEIGKGQALGARWPMAGDPLCGTPEKKLGEEQAR